MGVRKGEGSQRVITWTPTTGSAAQSPALASGRVRGPGKHTCPSTPSTVEGNRLPPCPQAWPFAASPVIDGVWPRRVRRDGGEWRAEWGERKRVATSAAKGTGLAPFLPDAVAEAVATDVRASSAQARCSAVFMLDDFLLEVGW